MPLPRPAPGTGMWWVLGVAGCTVGAGLATWLALANTVGQVTWVDTGYRDVTSSSVTVDFDVHRAPGVQVTCTVKALDQAFGVVGLRTVDVPASSERAIHQRVTVRTTSRPVTGIVKECTKR